MGLFQCCCCRRASWICWFSVWSLLFLGRKPRGSNFVSIIVCCCISKNKLVVIFSELWAWEREPCIALEVLVWITFLKKYIFNCSCIHVVFSLCSVWQMFFCYSEPFQVIFLFSCVFDQLIKLITLKMSYFSIEIVLLFGAEVDFWLRSWYLISWIRSIICHQNKGIAIYVL